MADDELSGGVRRAAGEALETGSATGEAHVPDLPTRRRVRVPASKLKRHGKTRLGGVATLLDGRVATLDEKKVRRCR